MKDILLVWMLICCTSSLFSQEIRFAKRETSNLKAASSFNVSRSGVDFAKLLEKIVDPSIRNAKDTNGDRLFYVNFSENLAYKLVTKDGHRFLTKMVGHSEVKRMEVPKEGGFVAVGKGDYIIYDDYAHGDASAYTFYDRNLEISNVYKPYPYGFSIAKCGFSENLVCIYSQEQRTSDSYKLTLLSPEGKVLRTREFSSDGFVPSDIKVIGNRILILLNDSKSIATRILTMSTGFTVMWQKDITTRVVNYRLSVSEQANALLVNTHHNVTCMSLKDGIKVWEKDLPDQNINAQFILNGQFIALIHGKGSEIQYTENELQVLSTKTGQWLYSDQLQDTDDVIEILDGEESFFIGIKSSFNEYYQQK